MSASFTITRGYSIGGGMRVPAWRTVTRGYGLGSVPPSVDLSPLQYQTPCRRLDGRADEAVDYLTPGRPLDVVWERH